MFRQLKLITSPIDAAALLAGHKASAESGAVVYFLGVVRGAEADAPIDGLDYESFERMAEHQFNLLFDQVEKRWPVESIRLVHRLGVVRVGESSLWVEVIAPHRDEAFAACQWLIDEMKRVVPIWKKSLKTIGSEPRRGTTQPVDDVIRGTPAAARATTDSSAK